MGLLLDANAFPMGFDVFAGNESEKIHMRPILDRMRKQHQIKRMIVVADRGLNTADNIFYLNGYNTGDDNQQDGYIYGQSIRGASKAFKEWALDRKGYTTDLIDAVDAFGEPTGEKIKWRHKSRKDSKKLEVHVGPENSKGKKTHTKTVYVDQKQMVYYSEKYARKQKHTRDEAVARAKDLIANPKKYDRVTASGAASYVKHVSFNKDTGEIVSGRAMELDIAKIKEEEKYDGYYSIVTSELDMSDIDLRNAYRELVIIEQTFRIFKSDLEARPVHVRLNEHIEGHFLTCYVALVLLRLLEIKLGRKYTTTQILTSLRHYCCSRVEGNLYLFTYLSSVIASLGLEFDVEVRKKYRKQLQIRRMIGY